MKHKSLFYSVVSLFMVCALTLFNIAPIIPNLSVSADSTGGQPVSAPVKRAAVPPTIDKPLSEAIEVVLKEENDTYMNPLNISYEYYSTMRARESADPAGILFKGEYYLFASHGSGYWWSEDMADWNYIYALGSDNLIPPDRATNDILRYAPAVCVIPIDGEEWLYLTHSESGAFFRTQTPKDPDTWEFVSRPPGWQDPGMLYDEDTELVYVYHGLSHQNPIWIEVFDPNNNMKQVGTRQEAFWNNPKVNGFEVAGNNNENYGNNSTMEGAWMTKHNGKYYLQYAIPDTAVSGYANGCYVADDPLGPFEYCDYSPVTSKYTGFISASGHGSMMQDVYGEWWSVQTVVINGFQRRLSITPVKFTEDGKLISNSVFADYPLYKPEIEERTFENPGPEWNLVSYGATVTGVSSTNGSNVSANAFNENMRNWWSAATGNPGEYIQADLGKLTAVNALQINFADQDALRDEDVPGTGVVSGRNHTWRYRYLMEFSTKENPGVNDWYPLIDKSSATAEPFKGEDYSHEYFELAKTIGVRHIRITNKGDIPAYGKFAISGIRLFGHGQSEAPALPDDFTVIRHAGDERQATISWDAVPGAEGYIVRYGAYEDTLNICRQVIGTNSVNVRNLTKGVGYYFTVDAYNDSGYIMGTELKFVDSYAPLPDSREFLRATVDNLYTGSMMSGFPSELGYNGAYVESFIDGSYALALDLRQGDIITQLNGETVTGSASLIEMYGAVADGENINLKVWRKGRYVPISFVKGVFNDYINTPCKIEAEDYDYTIGRIDNEGVMRPSKNNCSDVGGGKNLGNIGGGDWVGYRLNFSTPPETITLRCALPQGDSRTISLYLDSMESSPIAAVTITPTGGVNDWNVYQDFVAELPEITGPYTLYLKFSNSLNINWLSLDVAEEQGVDETYVAANFSALEGNYTATGGSQTFGIGWRNLDGNTIADVTGHDIEKLYLRINLNLASSETAVSLANAFTIGEVKLRSVDVTDKPGDPYPNPPNSEHNWGWNIKDNWGLKIGDNLIDIPLKDAIERDFKNDNNTIYCSNNSRGLMDWTTINRIWFVLNSTNRAEYAGITFTLNITGAKIVDITTEEEKAQLKALADDFIEYDDYTRTSYNAYLEAVAFAYQEIEFADVIKDVRIAAAGLQAAIDGLTKRTPQDVTAELKEDLLLLLETEYLEKNYTVDSYEVYSIAKEAAELVLSKENPSNEELEAAIEALEQAILGLEEAEADVIQLGDVNLDEDINIFDIMMIRDHIFGKTILEGDNAIAADVNEDEDINIFDIMMIRDHIFGKNSLM